MSGLSREQLAKIADQMTYQASIPIETKLMNAQLSASTGSPCGSGVVSPHRFDDVRSKSTEDSKGWFHTARDGTKVYDAQKGVDGDMCIFGQHKMTLAEKRHHNNNCSPFDTLSILLPLGITAYQIGMEIYRSGIDLI